MLVLLSSLILPSASPTGSTVCSLHLLLHSFPTDRFFGTAFLDSTYMIFVFLFLTSLYVTGSRLFHLTTTDSNLFLSWLSNIPLYIYIYHIFFIRSSVDGHLGCFHVQAIVNSAAVSIRVQVSFCFVFFFSGIFLNCGFLRVFGLNRNRRG